MNIAKQTLKTIPRTKILMCLGLALGLWVFFLGAGTADAASKQAENACNQVAATQELRQACYYGYDKIGDSQNRGKKCRNKYLNNNQKQAVCITGAALARKAASKPPKIDRCERSKQCIKAYRKCVRKKGKKAQTQCKRQAIGDPEKKGGGGADGGSTDAPATGEVGDYICGTFKDEKRNVHTKFDFGCIGTKFAKTGQGQANLSPIHDLTFAFIRFLSVGVGIVMAISIIMSAIQYSMSEGNAEVTQKAKSRIRSAVMGLALYIFAFSILQFLIPGGVFRAGMWVDENILQLLSRLLL